MLKKMNLFDKKHNLSLFFLVFCKVWDNNKCSGFQERKQWNTFIISARRKRYIF